MQKLVWSPLLFDPEIRRKKIRKWTRHLSWKKFPLEGKKRAQCVIWQRRKKINDWTFSIFQRESVCWKQKRAMFGRSVKESASEGSWFLLFWVSASTRMITACAEGAKTFLIPPLYRLFSLSIPLFGSQNFFDPPWISPPPHQSIYEHSLNLKFLNLGYTQYGIFLIFHDFNFCIIMLLLILWKIRNIQCWVYHQFKKFRFIA